MKAMTSDPQALNPDDSPTGAYQVEESASELVRVLDEFLTDLQAGRAPDREQLLAAHPDIAGQLEQCLAGIAFIHQAAQPAAAAPTQLGDFRIVREIGRGGIGVVYEAEQVSLKRKVALKVLRFGAVADAEVMERFRREAETVARLHHTNIVPVFAVGEEHGVHYYAMQFIEGRSLAAVIEEHARQRVPVRPADLAGWGLQAAEALAHAHQRGVIHRDIKPSNLLLDPEGVVWLTDFGLARRVDEVVLTATGVLMGTPRYMSPEQAAGVKKPVDHRTDIYSLGATLYELATGKPVFEADTPHAVITQILSAEPVRPRRLQGDLPRDLETIILKCLAKDAGRPYASAQALADDLRAFLDGRPIKARQARWHEQAWRWAKKRRRVLALTAVTAVVAAVLALGSLSVWKSYREHQLGRLLLTTDGPYLKAEVLNERDEAVVPAFTVPAQDWVLLTPGSYRVRLSGPGLVSETLSVDIERGGKHEFKVGLEARRLWESPADSYGDRVAAVDLGQRTDLVRMSAERDVVSRLDGGTGKPVWQKRLDYVKPKVRGQGLTYEQWQQRVTILSENWPDDLPLLAAAPDLNRDGVGDLIWFSRKTAALWALSGRDGQELWWYDGGPGRIVASPAVIDGDGTPDLIATMVAGGQRCLQAISGRTGKPLWRFPLEDAWFADAAALPFAAEVVRVGGRPVILCQAGSRLIGLDPATGKPTWPIHDLGFTPLRTPHLVDGARPLVLVLRELGPETLELSALAWASGEAAWKRSLRAHWPESREGQSAREQGKPLPPPAWPLVADLDGDGRPVVIVANKPARDRPEPEREPDTIHIDLDERSTDWAALEVLDAATGELRWQRRLHGNAPKGMFQLEQFVVGPDIDGDGHRDLFVASFGQPRREEPGEGRDTHHDLFVTALSGRDGHTLWWWREHRRIGDEDFIPPLRWWQTGPDGRPELLVSCNSNFSHNIPKSPSTTFALVAGTGRLAHVLPEVADPGVADLNGDGGPDLYFIYRSPQKKWSGEPRSTRLVALRGRGPFAEAWRRLGNWTPMRDVDGDGIPDLLQANKEAKTTTAVAGADGRVLWRSPVAGDFTAPPLPQGDLDGDGVPDLITKSPLKRLAISGKTGRVLWPPQPLKPDHPSFEDKDLKAEDSVEMSHYTPGLPEATCLPLTRDHKPAVVYAYLLGFGSTRLSELDQRQSQLWIAAADGVTGRVVWKQPLSERGSRHGYDLRIITATDLDGDGQPDLLVLVGLPEQPWELRALHGNDGRELWRHSLAAPALSIPSHGRVALPVLVGDWSGSGAPQIVVVDRVCERGEEATPPGGKPRIGRSHFQVQALAGKDGRPLWTWRGPELAPLTLPASDEIPWNAEAVLANLEGVGPAVCLHLGQYHPEQTRPRDGDVVTSWQIVLGADGRERQRRVVPLPAARCIGTLNPLWLGTLRAFDLDGDGRQELLWFFSRRHDEPGSLQAFRGGFDRLWWEARLPLSGLRDLRVVGRGVPATVAATGRFTGHEDTYSLDGATGQVRWHIVGKHTLLETDTAGTAPRFITQDGDSTACFVGGAAPEASPAPAAVLPDPRLARYLPWADAVMRQFFLVSIAISLALLGVPGLLLGAAVRRRSWRWGLVLVAYLALAGYACATEWIPRSLSSLGELFYVLTFLHAADVVLSPLHDLVKISLDIRWLRAVLGLPALVFAGVLVVGLVRWRWQRVAWLLLALVLVTPLAGAIIFWLDDPKYDPAQYYSWAGWYWLGPVGMYFTGVVLLALFLLGGPVRVLRRSARRLRARFVSAPSTPV